MNYSSPVSELIAKKVLVLIPGSALVRIPIPASVQIPASCISIDRDTGIGKIPNAGLNIGICLTKTSIGYLTDASNSISINTDSNRNTSTSIVTDTSIMIVTTLISGSICAKTSISVSHHVYTKIRY